MPYRAERSEGTRTDEDLVLSPVVTVVSESERDGGAENGPTTDRPSSLAEALEVRRNARIGVTAGLGVAAALYVPTLAAVEFSLGGAGGLYLGLAFVLAATMAGLVTAVLCAKAFLHPVLDGRAWVRRGATAGTLGGIAWAGLPLAAVLVDVGVASDHHWRWLAVLAAFALALGTAALHAVVRDAFGTVREAATGEAVTRDVAAGSAAAGDAASENAAARSEATDRSTSTIDRLPSISRRRFLQASERVAYWVVLVGLFLAAGNATGSVEPILETDIGPIPTPFLAATFLALVAAIPFAATAELSSALPPWPVWSLLAGSLCGVLGVAWLVTLGGWPFLVATVDSPTAVALAVVAVPSGLGWAVVSYELRTLATHEVERAGASRSVPEGPNK